MRDEATAASQAVVEQPVDHRAAPAHVICCDKQANTTSSLLLADSRRFYAAAFDKASLDRESGPATEAPDVVYNVTKLADGMPATLAATVAESPMRCAIMRLAPPPPLR
jgi:hypothetical protein